MEPLEIDEPLPLEERFLKDTTMSSGEPSKPVLGLPLARLVPQDCHSYMDYGNGAAALACVFVTDDKAAQLASLVLAGSVVGVSAITDYRMSLAKIVPIEAHEVIDHAWGVMAIAAPFALGYWKTSPKVAIAHIAAGVGTILGSLLTDYRAYSRRHRR
ncbi:MAG TPA: hypothetical protein VK427_13305 [Kofleriaceae bacterium]|nr:hypothetical protein [Kofleriaceae bacterium]